MALTKWLDECPQLHDKARYQQPIQEVGPNKKTHPHMFHPSGELDHDWETSANHEWKQGKDGTGGIPGQEEEDDDEEDEDEYKEEI